MSELMLPPTWAVLLTAFTSCFQARSYLTFQWLTLGWVQCQGRRTVTEVALASGAVGERHISVFHRFFSRASWALDTLGQVLFTLALQWVPADQPLVVLGDDTLSRKGGKSIALASMHHDPLLSSAREPFASFGHVWVVLALWVPLPFGSGRGFALPVLFRLYVSTKRGGERHRAGQRQARVGPRLRAARTAHAQHQQVTKLELLREMVDLLAGWAGERTVYLVVDSAYAGRTVLEDRPANVHVISRLRWDAALYAPPPPRRPGQKGRPRRRGERLPPLQQLIARRRRWTTLPLVLYGRAVTPRILMLEALWYGALRSQLVRIVVVRDPSGRRHDEAFFCTDLTQDPAFILQTYAARWTLEVTFHDTKQHLGFGQAQNQTPQAVGRTAPFAGVVYRLVLLWAAAHLQQGGTLSWIVRPWYPTKTAVAFPDLLMALRQELWRTHFSAPPVPARRPQNPAPVHRHTQRRAA
ncbi:MAG TPA: transposase [Candidatus Dormibacteraeota bacterium]|nr:transposase [Candidatus Dormibacteraeota bacterium]